FLGDVSLAGTVRRHNVNSTVAVAPGGKRYLRQAVMLDICCAESCLHSRPARRTHANDDSEPYHYQQREPNVTTRLEPALRANCNPRTARRFSYLVQG